MGGAQRYERNDWIVDNEGDIYTVDAQVFARTYRCVSADHYVKTTPVWAEVAAESGSLPTREGESHYQAGDYLVYNDEEGNDAYLL